MTPDELQAAIARFESSGGQVRFVEAVVRAERSPEPLPDVDETLVEAIRGFVDKGVCAAAKALRRSTRTINRIAGLYGIKFATTTDATLEDWRKEEAKLVPRIRRLAQSSMSQIAIAEQVGISRMTLRRIARYHGININSRAH